jgi:hypothetical protein
MIVHHHFFHLFVDVSHTQTQTHQLQSHLFLWRNDKTRKNGSNADRDQE